MAKNSNASDAHIHNTTTTTTTREVATDDDESGAHYIITRQYILQAKMAQSTSGSGGGGNDPWAWLGLLKWSLSYVDGTAPTSGVTQMSDEDRAFLEKVMKEGIIDEGDRMKEILEQVTAVFTKWKEGKDGGIPHDGDGNDNEDVQRVDDLLEEVRDIVEQIDYARAFCSMKGLAFLLGSVQLQSGSDEQSTSSLQQLPESTRCLLLGILATLASNNPPVQDELLRDGALGILTQVYYQNSARNDGSSSGSNSNSNNNKIRTRTVQALSAAVRSHAAAEEVFCQLDTSLPLIESGLSPTGASPALRKRSLFFLKALLTSDTAPPDRIRKFANCIRYVVDRYLISDTCGGQELDESELREMALEMIERILDQSKSVDAVLERKEALASSGIRHIEALRRARDQNNSNAKEDHEESRYGNAELESWERLLVLLSEATPDDADAAAAEPVPPTRLLEADKTAPEQ